MAVDWSKRGDYIAKHGITPDQADEPLNDANAVIFDPDYNTKSGRQVRTLGYSPSAQAVLSAITPRQGRCRMGRQRMAVQQP